MTPQQAAAHLAAKRTDAHRPYALITALPLIAPKETSHAHH